MFVLVSREFVISHPAVKRFASNVSVCVVPKTRRFTSTEILEAFSCDVLMSGTAMSATFMVLTFRVEMFAVVEERLSAVRIGISTDEFMPPLTMIPLFGLDASLPILKSNNARFPSWNAVVPCVFQKKFCVCDVGFITDRVLWNCANPVAVSWFVVIRVAALMVEVLMSNEDILGI